MMEWQFYKDKRGKHRWRVRGKNGEIIGASTQGYSSASLAKENAELFGYNECR